ncbi:gas vesicle protein GvpD [Haloarcula pelagica]|uniref:gas vesicle protein GvpD n=1 Tax=Haloarcula pelagica TaxID=3033389 RepID=UPI0024C44A4F|nr:gas vesicle protein GvpD [Halomicroarcula sp. YJ-61-S]
MTTSETGRLSTGVDGLDGVLDGGLLGGRSYLVRGAPGTGKTVLGLHFLTEGAAAGESVLYINLEEATDDIRENATALGFDLSGVTFLDLSPSSAFFAEDQSYSIFEADEVDREPIQRRIRDSVDEMEPDRVFVDPVTQFRYLSSDEFQFRKEVISFMRYLKEADATVLFTSQRSAETPDDDLQFLADGIVELRRDDEGRSLSVPKFRGSDRQSGAHSMEITDAGISVYPILDPGDHATEFDTTPIPSGNAELDTLLGGGIERGTITVVSGPTGVGKTTTGTLFMQAAADQGERSAIYHFEESPRTFRHRCESIGIPVSTLETDGALTVEAVEALDYSAEQFAAHVREQVEERGVSVVMIDGINGYKLSLQGNEDALVGKLHALGRYLKNMGVTVIFVDEVGSVTGSFEATEAGISYLADNVVFLRHIELNGELRKVVGVLKKRVSTFERTLREFEITSDGIVIGDPLTDASGLLEGTPDIERSDR